MNQPVNFESIPWESPMEGFNQKVFIENNKKIRLVALERGFSENDWCSKPHQGYVLRGTLRLEFPDKIELFRTGDIISLQKEEKHKIQLTSDLFATLILFEDV